MARGNKQAHLSRDQGDSHAKSSRKLERDGCSGRDKQRRLWLRLRRAAVSRQLLQETLNQEEGFGPGSLIRGMKAAEGHGEQIPWE